MNGKKKAKDWLDTERMLSIFSPILLLLIWEAATQAGLLDYRFFPAPSKVLVTLWSMVESGALWVDLKASLYRLGLGLFFGIVPGVVIGVIIGLSRWVRAVLNPMVAALYPIPKTAILPLIILILGLGETSKIVLVGISVFFLVLMNAAAGVMHIDKIFFDVGRTFEATRWQTFRTIALPGARPLIMTGIRLAVGMALIILVVAEFTGAKAGIGFLIWNSWQIFDVPMMYAGLLVISLLGFAASIALDELERIIVPWKPRRQ